MAMRLRFTIRDLLWLTLVVAMAAGWWADHRQFEPSEPIKVDLPNSRFDLSAEVYPQTQ
jgi:hypothetical protein